MSQLQPPRQCTLRLGQAASPASEVKGRSRATGQRRWDLWELRGHRRTPSPSLPTPHPPTAPRCKRKRPRAPPRALALAPSPAEIPS
eukprot:6209837-Pleurochrysis_carterae.AAC.3